MSDDNDLDFDDEVEDQEPESQAQDSQVLRDLRKKLRKTQADLKDRDKIIEELTPFRDRVRTLEVGSVFKEVGLTDKQAGLYPKDAETTAEKVREWAETYGLVTKEPEPEATPEPAFPPPVRGEAPGATRNLSWSEYVAMKNSGDKDQQRRAHEARIANLVDESTHPNLSRR